MKIYNLEKLSFDVNNSRANYPRSGALVKCRGQIGICYTYMPSADEIHCKVYLLGANDLPYIVVNYSHTSCEEITPPAGYTEDYGRHLCEAWSCVPHKYTPEGIIFKVNK